MLILPAIDLIDGKPVRLVQGDYAKKSIVADSALQQAQKFEEEGAEMLHLVDLDGAKAGKPENQELIFKIAGTLQIPVEVGGGIRSLEEIRNYLDHGIKRVILGTKAIEDEAFVKEALETFPGRIVISLDCRDGKPALEGWQKQSDLDGFELAARLAELGARTIVFTDIATDGVLSGPNLPSLKKLRQAVGDDVEIVASGGVSSLKDLLDLKEAGMDSAIVGKALYSKNVDLKEALELC